MTGSDFPFPLNDSPCGWRLGLDELPSRPVIKGNQKTDWLVIGAGFTGLAAARRIAELEPHARVVLLDAEKAGQGASSRNSGYIVDSTLNDGGRTQADKSAYWQKYQHNLAGIERLRRQVQQHAIACDWDEAGKYHCAAQLKHIGRLQGFSAMLGELDIKHQMLDAGQLKTQLGTGFYQAAVKTSGGVLVNPAALVDGLISTLPPSVECYDNSPVLSIQQGSVIRVETSEASIEAKQVIVAVNALMPQLGIAKRQVFPLTLTASITRRLSDEEYAAIGKPKPWGVLSVQPMGATVRLSNDRRIMVRNTVESISKLAFDSRELLARKAKHLLGLQKRFPELDQLRFAASWSGNVCISRNSKPYFRSLNKHLHVAGCYNAGGIAMGTLFGELIVEQAMPNRSIEPQNRQLIDEIQALDQPSRLPPQPFLAVGLQTRLAWQRFRGQKEA